VKWALNTVHVVRIKINSFTYRLSSKIGSELVKKGREFFFIGNRRQFTTLTKGNHHGA